MALNDKLQSGPDLLQSAIEINFRFRQHQIALSAELEAVSLPQSQAMTTDFYHFSD